MAAKLHQILPIVTSTKARVTRRMTDIYKRIQTPIFGGISRTYRPRDDEGEALPPESQKVQYTVDQATDEFAEAFKEMLDIVATQDATNCIAKADIKIDDKVLVAQVPVTHLLFLAKQFEHLHTFITHMPVLDPAEDWKKDETAGVWSTPERLTTKTKKVHRNHEAAPATKEHPAQVQVYTEDQIIGDWSTKKFSGAVTQQRKNVLLDRAIKLQKAIHMAREEANGKEVVKLETGPAICNYLFE